MRTPALNEASSVLNIQTTAGNEKTRGTRDQTHPILRFVPLSGQFLSEDVGLAELPAGGDSKPSQVLKVKDRSVPVVRKSRRIYGGTQNVDCWFARNNAAKLIDGRYEDYVTTHMFDTGDEPHGTNKA